jgi:hypothetical protein
MMAKGTYGWILLATADLNGTFEKVQAGGAEVVQEPTEQPYGIRDCAFRDPAGKSGPHPGTALSDPAAADPADDCTTVHYRRYPVGPR